jgi:hypothetical protein
MFSFISSSTSRFHTVMVSTYSAYGNGTFVRFLISETPKTKSNDLSSYPKLIYVNYWILISNSHKPVYSITVKQIMYCRFPGSSQYL